MRPKAQLGIALPLAVGVEGLSELAEFELAEPADSGFASRLGDCLPEHMRLLDVRPYKARRSLAARVVGASYEAEVMAAEGTDCSAGKLQAACLRFAESERLPVEEVRQGETREVDVRRYVDSVLVQDRNDGGLLVRFTAKVSPAGTTRPEHVVKALETLAGLDLVVERLTRLHIDLAGDEQ
jgi:radical SAM-linked protein